MDHHQHAHSHSQEHIDMHDPALTQHQYPFYAQDVTDQTYTPMPFVQEHRLANYEVVPNAHPPRHMSTGDLQQAFHFRSMNLMAGHQYPNPAFDPSSPPNLNLPLESQLPPQSPTYDPLSPPVSGSDTSGDNIYHSRNSSGTTSPASSRGASLVHRTARYNPTPSPSSSSGRRRGRSIDSEEDDPNNNMNMVQELQHSRKEATRRQRIEAEQRRRDELRDGYARLKDVLPVSNQKSSKVSLLERATNYIIQLDKSTRQMQTRLAALENEVQRLRALNEKISLSVGAGTPEENKTISQLVPVTVQPPREDSSGSERGL